MTECTDLTDDDQGRYFVGTAFLSNDKFLVEYALVNKIFYQYPPKSLLRHLLRTATHPPNWKRLEIMKMEFEPMDRGPWLCYTCVLKTHYLRLVQRRWRSILQQRRALLQQQALSYLRHRERGKRSTLSLPTLRGMLADLRKSPLL
jgi:hypothetical protein